MNRPKFKIQVLFKIKLLDIQGEKYAFREIYS